jgi:tRNA (cytidine/uridine-2'-O-)-methyltransferase
VTAPRLRCSPVAPPFRIVLVEPEIPQNTGNIARLCAATTSPLHLVGRLGFRIDEHAVRRAGLDYWPLVQLEQHVSFDHFLNAHPGCRPVLFSARAGRSYLDAAFAPGDALVFGRESTGLGADVLDRFPDSVYTIPTSGPVRSLNLANVAAIVLYEALRQSGGLEATFLG